MHDNEIMLKTGGASLSFCGKTITFNRALFPNKYIFPSVNNLKGVFSLNF